MPRTIITVAAIRPDLIRLAFLIERLDANPAFRHIFIFTGQHYQKELKDVFFDDLGIRQPDYTLSAGAPGREHFEQLSVLQMQLVNLIRQGSLNPDIILFLGDSNSSLVAPVLKKMGWRIGHIEAGMRSGDPWMPEEINRVACDHCADLLFTYHETYSHNLIREGIDRRGIYCVGNTITEPTMQFRRSCGETRPHNCSEILVDIHRDENIRNPERLRDIFQRLSNMRTRCRKTVTLIKFPRTMSALSAAHLDPADWNFQTVGLMSYKQFMLRQLRAFCLFSDSGTAQEEGPLLGVPVVVPRSCTERPMSIRNDCSVMMDVTDPKAARIASEYAISVDAGELVPNTDWLGDGQASHWIAGYLENPEVWSKMR